MLGDSDFRRKVCNLLKTVGSLRNQDRRSGKKRCQNGYANIGGRAHKRNSDKQLGGVPVQGFKIAFKDQGFMPLDKPIILDYISHNGNKNTGNTVPFKQ